MRKKILLFTNPDFDKKYMGGISRLYQIFCVQYNFSLEIIDEDFLKNHKPEEKELIVTAGGDGTLHYAVNIIPEKYLSRYEFGIIPAGTANEFAKSLNIPYFLEEAAFLIANRTGKNKTFHKIAVINGKHKFLTGMLYGVGCQVLQAPSRSAKTLWGPFAYNLPAFLSLANFYDYIKNFKIDSIEFQTGYLLINNASLVSKDIPDEVITEESRDLFSLIYVSSEVTTSDMVRLLMKNQARMNVLQDTSIFYTRMKEIKLEFEEESLFMLDGEIYNLSSPLHIKHHEKNIEVICS
jgi:diacylglycerol kinase (ATP)